LLKIVILFFKMKIKVIKNGRSMNKNVKNRIFFLKDKNCFENMEQLFIC